MKSSLTKTLGLLGGLTVATLGVGCTDKEKTAEGNTTRGRTQQSLQGSKPAPLPEDLQFPPTRVAPMSPDEFERTPAGDKIIQQVFPGANGTCQPLNVEGFRLEYRGNVRIVLKKNPGMTMWECAHDKLAVDDPEPLVLARPDGSDASDISDRIEKWDGQEGKE